MKTQAYWPDKPTLRRVALMVALGLSLPALAAEDSYDTRGAVADGLYYSVGGGRVASRPPNTGNLQKVGVGVKWNADMICGNFDLKNTVSNQLNGITDGFKDLMGDVISNATGAVMSYPGAALQRANPGLYEMITNGTLQANTWFDKAKLSCQSMSDKLADYTTTGEWSKTAVAEEYKSVVGNTTDAVAADRKKDTLTGKEGVVWIGGEKRGGQGQKAIRPTHDVAQAGYNLLNNQSVTSTASVSSSECKATLCKRYANSEEAATAVEKVLGDSAIRTCATPDECTSGGEENQAGMSTPGTGFAPMLDEATEKNLEILTQLVNGSLAATDENLATLQTGELGITRNIIESLKHDPDNGVLTTRLASDMAMADVVEVALGMRRMLSTGKREPNAGNSKPAAAVVSETLEQLDKEIAALATEMALRRAVANNAAMSILQRRAQRDEVSKSRELEDDVDNRVSELSEPATTENR